MTKLGIDYGTTTTVGAIVSGGDIEPLADEAGRIVIPSFVAFPPAGGCLIGDEAKYRRPIDAENTLFSMKRIIGLGWSNSVVREFVEKYPFTLEATEDGIPRFRLRAGRFDAVEVSAKLIGHILEAAAHKAGPLEVVVIGVPSDFTSQRRIATVEAVREAGFEGAVCVDEPLAIARAYMQEGDIEAKRVAIYDLGGGTFDVAICEIKPNDCVLLAAGGDQFLGGDDIDLACAEMVAVDVLRQLHWDILTDFEARTRLLAECERAKIQLSTMQATRIKLRAIENAEMFVGKEISIERQQLERWAYDLARRSFVVCDEVVARAGLVLDDIDEVFLAGGTSRIPAIQRAVSHYFGKEPRVSEKPDHLVAIGAAVIARDLARPAVSSETPSGVERRRDLRRKTSLRVRVRFEDLAEFQTLFAYDISEGGTFLAMVNPPKPGNVVLLQVEIGGDETLELNARVVRRVITAREGAVSGVGVEFIDAGAEEKAALQTLLSQTEQLFGPARPRGKTSVPPAGVLEK